MGRHAGAPCSGCASRGKREESPWDLQITQWGVNGHCRLGQGCPWPGGPGTSQSRSGPALPIKRWGSRESVRPQEPMIPAAGRQDELMRPQNFSISKGQPEQVWEFGQNTRTAYFHHNPSSSIPGGGKEG